MRRERAAFSSGIFLFAAAAAAAAGSAGCPRHVCGNGTVERGEECDDGNAVDEDACTSLCRINICGDGFLGGAGEECDDGAANADVPDACRTGCLSPGCGDLIVDTGEECDDGNNVNGDGCSVACQNDLASCGNGAIDAGEACDNGAANSDTMPNACRTDCSLPGCGDGVVDSAEECDDGNTTAGDGCDDLCQAELGCGNGIVDGTEECDDDNVVSGDGCDAACVVEFCGDGVLNNAPAEQCEPPAAGDCDATCVVPPDACGAAITLTQILPSSATPGTTSGTGTFAGTCSASSLTAGEDAYVVAWGGFTGPADLVFSLEPGPATNFDSVLYVRTPPCLGGAEVPGACDDVFPGLGGEQAAVLDAAPGTYYVFVDGFNGAVGDYVLDFAVRPVLGGGAVCDPAEVTDRCQTGLDCADDGTGVFTCTNAMIMACMAATPLAAGATVAGTIDVTDPDVFGWSPAGACGSFDPGSGEDVYVMTLTGAAQDLLLSIDGTPGTDFDTVLYVRSPGCEVVTDELGCSDVVAIGTESLTLLDLPAGDYYVIVDGWNGNVGNYTLNANVRAVNGLGGACDPAGVTARCTAGLNCASGMCATPACGDGTLDPGEECDDANTTAGDGCSDLCLVEATPEVEVNDTILDAMAPGQPVVTVSTLFTGDQVLATDVDVFHIVLTTYADVSVVTGTDATLGCSGAFIDAALQDAAGTDLAADAGTTGDECGAVDPGVASGARALPPGDYYAVIDVPAGGLTYFMRIVITPVLVINEVLPDPTGTPGFDSNCSGGAPESAADEFIEIVNVGAGDLTISGWQYWDLLATPTLRFTFATPTVVPAGGVVVIYSGGTPACTFPPNVQVFVSTAVLNNAADTVEIRDAAGTVVSSATWDSDTMTPIPAAPDGASLTLFPDLSDTDPSQTVAGPYVAHDGISASLASPGTRTDGSAF
jgi:cysteine-rich repeat protein